MAIVKHIKSRNANYSDALDYLIFQHDESTGKMILDEFNRPLRRDELYMDGLNCNPDTFDVECYECNEHFKKNRSKSEIKSHHYIISYDPADAIECDLTGEKAQALSLELAKKIFPGYQALIVTHTDGHNGSGNIHTHIVINSVRKNTVKRESYMTQPHDHEAGYKHRSTNKFLDYFKKEIMDMCIQEGLHQIDLLSPAETKVPQAEYMDDLMALYQKSFTDKTVDRIASLPHPTVQKFTVITVAIVGASRRFLAQITRHQNEVKFMSASLQYSNYSEKAAFVIPYEILFSEQRYIDLYLQSCLSDLRCYQELCSVGFHHDSAGYALPHALRNILIICATPYEWKHMISQRICRRNTDETRIVMLDIWQKLYEFDPVLFSPKLTGPFCQRGCCEEGAMSCGIPIPKDWSPLEIMKADYPLLVEGREAVYEN